MNRGSVANNRNSVFGIAPTVGYGLISILGLLVSDCLDIAFDRVVRVARLKPKKAYARASVLVRKWLEY